MAKREGFHRAASIKVADSPILKTTNYEKFELMEGNRNIDPLHVKRMKKLMTENGNLTPENPILINDKDEIIDGQHRFTALKELGWAVFYQVREDMTLANVRALNVGNKNWSWYDFAQSYAKLDNHNYIRFVALADEFPGYGYSVIARYAGIRDVRSNLGSQGRRFRQGDMQFTPEMYQRARKLLTMYQEVAEFIPRPTTVTASAFYVVVTADAYDHARMVGKMQKYGERVFKKAWVNLTQSDILRAFEEVYNFHVREGDDKRLY